MRPIVDHQKCAGIGMCEMTAPDIFEVGDDGQARVKLDGVGDSYRALAEEAVSNCPAAALSLRS